MKSFYEFLSDHTGKDYNVVKMTRKEFEHYFPIWDKLQEEYLLSQSRKKQSSGDLL